tara:strand:- start:416 stop:2998 length:2583 start_codon:yes stop_codon:yes gene_type:complete
MGKRKATGAVPSDWTGQAKVFGSTIKENVDVLAGHNGDPLDKAVTGRDLIDAGVAQIAAVGTGGSSPLGYQPPTTQIPTYPAPPIVTGLEASGAFTIILLTWDMPVYLGFAYWEIWRNVNDDLANATLHATTTQLAGNYPDTVGSEKTYYYWVRGVNFNNVKGPFNATEGTVGNTQADLATILELLESGITTSQLATDLATPLGNLPSNTTSTIAAMQGQINTLSITAAWAIGESYILTDLATFNGNLYEVLVAHTSTVANQPTGAATNNTNWRYVGAFTSLASVTGANTASINDINYLDSSSNSAAAVRIASLTSDVATQASGLSAAATARNELGTRITSTETSITAQSTDITALETTVNNATTSVAATSTAVGGLTTRVTSAEGSIVSQASDIVALATTVNNATTGVAATATALDSIEILCNDTTTGVAASATKIGELSSGYVNPDGTSGTVTLQQAMTTQASVNGDLKGQYSVKIDTNGHVAGFGLSSTLVDDTPTSAFIINADKFALVSSSDTSDGLGTITPDSDNVPFFVHSDGKTYIKSATILDGSITNALIQNATIDGSLKVRNINADYIETGSIKTSLLNIDGSEITSVGGVLQLGEISANKITSGEINATQVTITNLYADSIAGDINTLVPFSLASPVEITGGATQVWAGQFPVQALAKKPYISAVGYGIWENDVVYKVELQMKVNAAPTGETVGIVTSASYVNMGQFGAWFSATFSGDRISVLPSGGTLEVGGAVKGIANYASYSPSLNVTTLIYSPQNGGLTEGDTVITTPIVAYQTVSTIMFRANFDDHPEPFSISGGLPTGQTATVDVRIMMDTMSTRYQAIPNVYHNTNWTHDQVFGLDGLMMSLR